MINISKICDPLPRWMRRQKLVQLLLTISPNSNMQVVALDNGAKLYADISDPFPRTYFLTRSYDPEFYRIAKIFLNHGGAFFDVGANFGFCTFGLLSSLPDINLECHLFEANQSICEALTKSMSFYPHAHIQLNHACVTDQKGESLLSIQTKQLGESYISERGAQKVNNLVLDEYLVERNIKKVNFLKMDIEGSEVLALKGAEKHLRSGAIESIYLEISALTLKRFESTPQDCMDYLKKMDYELFVVKRHDIDLMKSEGSPTKFLSINGANLEVCKINEYPMSYDTDILAVSKHSSHLKSIQ